jgi:hypothetical protein
MSLHYFDPSRAGEPWALTDSEVLHVGLDEYVDASGGCLDPLPSGWYWQACFPGCLPDGEPHGPFNSEAVALADAQGDHQ